MLPSSRTASARLSKAKAGLSRHIPARGLDSAWIQRCYYSQGSFRAREDGIEIGWKVRRGWRTSLTDGNQYGISMEARRYSTAMNRQGRTNELESKKQGIRGEDENNARVISTTQEKKRFGYGDPIVELKRKGLFHSQTSRSLSHHLSLRPRTIYVGIDPSAPSLHLGNLIPLIGLIHFRLAGHRTVVVIGGATGTIGDPTGRSTVRTSLSKWELERNIGLIRRQVEEVVERGVKAGGEEYRYGKGEGGDKVEDIPTIYLDNREWFEGIGFIDFLKEVGTEVRVGEMLGRESVQARLSTTGLSFTELTYQLMQGFDFYYLNSLARLKKVEEGGSKSSLASPSSSTSSPLPSPSPSSSSPTSPTTTETEPLSCTIQLGGSDQLGNIMCGIDLILKKNPNSSNSSATKPSSTIPHPSNPNPDPDPDPQKPSKSEAYGLTFPLLTNAKGEKFGKSSAGGGGDGAIWLDEGLTGVQGIYQFMYRTPATNLSHYLSIFSFPPPLLEDSSSSSSSSNSSSLTSSMSSSAVEADSNLVEKEGKKEEIDLDQETKQRKELAERVVRLVHGDSGLKKAQFFTHLSRASKEELDSIPLSKFEGYLPLPPRKAPISSNPDLATSESLTTAAKVKNNEKKTNPIKRMNRDEVVGEGIIKLITDLGIVDTRTQARSTILNKGLYLNGDRITDIGTRFCRSGEGREGEDGEDRGHLINGKFAVFRAGVRSKVVWVD